MSAKDTLDRYSCDQGWTQSSELALCLNYIDTLKGSGLKKFEEFLKEYADMENQPADVEQYDGPHFPVEWDRDYTGGDYSSVGEIGYVPLSLLDKMPVEKAIEEALGIHPMHVIHFTVDELYNSEGEEWEQCCEVCEHHEDEVGPLSATSCGKYTRICDDCLEDRKQGKL